MRLHRFILGALAIGLMSSSATVWADQSQNGLTDQAIRAEIEQRLADRNISGVTITVTQGVVVVDGTVVSAWAKNQACEEPRKIFGVTSVTCNISVPRRPRDSVIAFEVESWILDYAFYTIYDSVDVAVKDGRVTLTGVVMADARARTIADIASRVTGVVEVNNLLRTIVASPKDDDIRYEVAGRVYSNPVFSYGKMPGPVHIIVENGRVTLTGWVPSEGDRQLAEMIASAVPGVVRVENRLKCLIDD